MNEIEKAKGKGISNAKIWFSEKTKRYTSVKMTTGQKRKGTYKGLFPINLKTVINWTKTYKDTSYQNRLKKEIENGLLRWLSH